METQMEELMQMLRCYEKARSEGVTPENIELEKLLSAMKHHESNTEEHIKLPSKLKEDNNVPREEITPKPFFVVKTLNENKQKVFINMCGSEKIPGPANFEEADSQALEEALASAEEESINVRFPLSCSEPATSKDHGGQPCIVYDIVYNLSILEAAMSAKRVKVFIIETALTWISQKYNTQLSSEFKLPNLKYKGDTIRTQCIRGGPKGPLISEVPDVEAEQEPSFPLLAKSHKSISPVETAEIDERTAYEVNHAVESVLKTSPELHLSVEEHSKVPEMPQPEVTKCRNEVEEVVQEPMVFPLVQTEYIGRPAEFVFIHISFPGEIKEEDLVLIASPTLVTVEVKNFDRLEVPLLFPVSPEAAETELCSTMGLLTLKLPFMGYRKLFCCS